ncbi:MAG: demethoxyubiquinone hydroxylase family protein [Sphingobium sp.]|nr:demethoxyubiquinone hydroxylase family protein [Sphingobium sp.]
MMLAARLKHQETLGDRVIKVDHAGEHGATCIYRAQRRIARWRAPDLLPEIDDFISHEMHHRALFAAALAERGRPRCRSYHLCGVGGLFLGTITGFIGRRAIAATTVAIERVVLRHLEEQVRALSAVDPAAVALIGEIISDEQAHHDLSEARLSRRPWWTGVIDRIVEISTEAVIWLGMRL